MKVRGCTNARAALPLPWNRASARENIVCGLLIQSIVQPIIQSSLEHLKDLVRICACAQRGKRLSSFYAAMSHAPT